MPSSWLRLRLWLILYTAASSPSQQVRFAVDPVTLTLSVLPSSLSRSTRSHRLMVFFSVCLSLLWTWHSGSGYWSLGRGTRVQIARSTWSSGRKGARNRCGCEWPQRLLLCSTTVNRFIPFHANQIKNAHGSEVRRDCPELG